MTSWFVLFIVQARLVAHGHAGVHRRLGAFGALLALAVLVLGSMVAVTGARLGHSPPGAPPPLVFLARSEEHTSELQSLMRISYAVFCLKKKNRIKINKNTPKDSEK